MGHESRNGADHGHETRGRTGPPAERAGYRGRAGRAPGHAADGAQRMTGGSPSIMEGTSRGPGVRRRSRGAMRTRARSRAVWACVLAVAMAAMTLAPAPARSHAAGVDATTITGAPASSTTLPDGVTWPEVRRYVDAHFTGSRVFADAVYAAIHGSGQDYTDDRLTAAASVVSAADVIRYFGALDPDGTKITVERPLEPDAVLTGVTLLANTGVLEIRNVGAHTGLAFIEDAFTPAGSGESPYDTPEGPAIRVAPMNLTTLPKRPYTYNLTKSRSSHHFFNTTAYNDLAVNVVRDPKAGDARIDIDTVLIGRGASVELGAPGKGAGTSGDVVRPTEVTPTFHPRSGGAQPTDLVSASGNVVTMTIPGCGADGSYEERVAFDRLYQHFGNTVEQQFSIDYFYRTSVTYLSTVRATGEAVVLADLKARKIDDATGEPLEGAKFRLYEDKAGERPARQAISDGNGGVGRDEHGDVVMRETDVTFSDKDGVVHIPYLEPGDYYLREITPPVGFGLADPNPIKVTVGDGKTAAAGPVVSKGQGSEAKVLKPTNTARADDFKNASNWITASGNVVLTSEPAVARLKDGVYIRNGGRTIELTDFDAGGLTPLGGGEYVVTTGSDTLRFATAGEARDAVNAMIKGGKLTCDNAAITIDGGVRVYHRAAADDEIATIGNAPLPVHVRPFAAKVLKGDTLIDDRFRFTIVGSDGDGEVRETVGVKTIGDLIGTAREPGITGLAEFGALSFDKPGSYEFTITEEVDRSDTSVDYNTEGASYTLWVDVAHDGPPSSDSGATGDAGKPGDSATENPPNPAAADPGGAQSPGDPAASTAGGSGLAGGTKDVDVLKNSGGNKASDILARMGADGLNKSVVSETDGGANGDIGGDAVDGDAGSGDGKSENGNDVDGTGEAGGNGDKAESGGDVAGEEDGTDGDKDAPDTPDLPNFFGTSRGLVATVYVAKTTTRDDGAPVVGVKQLVGVYDSVGTNSAVMDDNGAIVEFTPEPARLPTSGFIRFTNIVKDTTLPHTGAAGLMAFSMAGLMLLLAGALIVTHDSRRAARR